MPTEPSLHTGAALSEQIKVGGPEMLPPVGGYRPKEQLDALSRDAAVAAELPTIRAQMAPRTSKRHGKGNGGT